MAPYLGQSEGDPDRALRLYEWSSRMSAAAFEAVGHFEVLLRNAIDRALSGHFTERDPGASPGSSSTPRCPEETSATIAAVRDRLRPLGHDSRHQVIAGLSFGFWSGMLGARYEDLWRSALRHAFPHSPGTRKAVSAPVEAIRKFRNRLAHGDSMLNVDIPFEMRRILDVTGYIDPQAKDLAGDGQPLQPGICRAAAQPHRYRRRAGAPTHGRSTSLPALTCASRGAGSSPLTAWRSTPTRRSRQTSRGSPSAAITCRGPPRRLPASAASGNRTDRKIGAVITASQAATRARRLRGMARRLVPGLPPHPARRSLSTAHCLWPCPTRGGGAGQPSCNGSGTSPCTRLQTAATTADLDNA